MVWIAILGPDPLMAKILWHSSTYHSSLMRKSTDVWEQKKQQQKNNNNNNNNNKKKKKKKKKN